MSNTIQQEPDRILRDPEVRERVGLSRATIWRKIRSGDIPAPVRLGPQSIGWIEREVNEWIAVRASARASPTRTNNFETVREDQTRPIARTGDLWAQPERDRTSGNGGPPKFGKD